MSFSDRNTGFVPQGSWDCKVFAAKCGEGPLSCCYACASRTCTCSVRAHAPGCLLPLQSAAPPHSCTAARFPASRTATAHAFSVTQPHVRLARDESRRTTADSGCRLRPPSRTAEPNAEHGARHAFYLCSPSRSLSCTASGTGYVAGQYDRCSIRVFVRHVSRFLSRDGIDV